MVLISELKFRLFKFNSSHEMKRGSEILVLCVILMNKSAYHHNNLVPVNHRGPFSRHNSPVKDSPSPHIPYCVILFSEAFFSRLDLSRGNTIAVDIGQAVVDLKLEVK